MLNDSLKLLLFSVQYGKEIQCEILDDQVTRRLCSIYKRHLHGKSRDLYHFLSLVRERHGEPLTTVLSEGIEEYLSLPKITEEEISGIKEYLLSLYKERKLLSIFGKYQYNSISTEGVSQVLDYIRKTISDIEQMEVSLSPKVLKVGDKLDEILSEIKEKLDNPGIPGLSTGFHSIDKVILGFQEGDLIYLGGRPSHGKTTLAQNMALKLAKRGVPVLFFSKEMLYKKLVRRFLSTMTGIQINRILTGEGLTEQDYNLIVEKSVLLKSLPLYIDEDFNRTADGIIEVSRKLIEEVGIKVIFIDYIQLIAERSSDSTHELGRISRRLKLMATDNNITVVTLSQLNRLLEQREDKRPKLSDLRQAGALEEDADVVMFCYRDELYNKDKSKFKGELEVIISKNRDGSIGSVFLDFDPTTLTVSEKRDENKQEKGV